MDCLIHLPNANLSAIHFGSTQEYIARIDGSNFMINVHVNKVDTDTSNVLGSFKHERSQLFLDNIGLILGSSENDRRGWIFSYPSIS
jgi:hypothetical protein